MRVTSLITSRDCRDTSKKWLESNSKLTQPWWWPFTSNKHRCRRCTSDNSKHNKLFLNNFNVPKEWICPKGRTWCWRVGGRLRLFLVAIYRQPRQNSKNQWATNHKPRIWCLSRPAVGMAPVSIKISSNSSRTGRARVCSILWIIILCSRRQPTQINEYLNLLFWLYIFNCN